MQFETPILFIIFNRIDTTERVFDVIRKMKPKQLFIAGDGPRYPLKNEYQKCVAVRSIINKIDWPCDIKTLFFDINLGCGKAVSSAITWFFDHVEEGIILEDDCLPSTDFFIFCRELLALYRDDKSVMSICGSTLLGKKFASQSGHYIGNSNGIWGWASWRRAWALYDYEMQQFYEPHHLEKMRIFFNNDIVFDHVVATFKLFLDGRYDTWDIQWYFAGLSNRAWAACPFQNMISNIGHEGAHDQYKSQLHDRETFLVDHEKIRERCIDKCLIKEAELYHYRFHRIYPKNLFIWQLQKHIFDIYVRMALSTLGYRPLRLEGYISAIYWHTKKGCRFINRLIRKRLWAKN